MATLLASRSRTDATTRLATDYTEPRSPVEAPDRDTLCDRCQAPLGDGVWQLSRRELGGNNATWTVCTRCDSEFVDWFWLRPGGADISGTKPLGGL